VFTGIVEELGVVTRADPGRLEVEARVVPRDSGPGASVAVNGVCLTVVDRGGDPQAGEPATLAFDVSDETLARTALGRLRPGDPVNLERPLTLMARLGGHLVQGHVDGVGTVSACDDAAIGRLMRVRVADELSRYLVEKGSVAVDGVSLTLTDVSVGEFGVALIPFTLEATTLGATLPGHAVNVEVDLIAKYVEGFLRLAPEPTDGRRDGER
jgi:riboflavin synthase